VIVLPRDEAESWLQSWDRQQERYLPDREERLRFLIGIVSSASPGKPLRVLDLACGPGSLTRRLLAARPDSEIVAVDLDPVLLSIYRSINPDVTVLETDLRREGWAEPIAGGFDAVVTATALHWMDGSAVRRVYCDLARLLVPGGVFLNADHAPLDDIPELSRRCAEVLESEVRALTGDRDDWESWWTHVEANPVLGKLVPERNRRFADRGDEFAPPADWHLSALADAGFAERAVVWRRGRDAIVAAVR
jgi:SAM-dependent methyltransferase